MKGKRMALWASTWRRACLGFVFVGTIAGASAQGVAGICPAEVFMGWWDEPTPFDLAGNALTFSPDSGSGGYQVSRERIDAFFVDPSGGAPLAIADDHFALCSLVGGKAFPFYGTAYDVFFVGDNGYITFGQGDTEYARALETHFNMPRVSAFFADLFRGSESAISWRQLDDRAVVTFSAVEDYATGDPNTFQIELFFNGVIRLSYLDIHSRNSLVGLSNGLGVPADFVASDFSDVPLDPLEIHFDAPLDFSGFRGGPFAEVAGVATNAGDAALSWSLVAGPDWLTFSPTGGTLPANGGAALACAPNAQAAALTLGRYDGLAVFSNSATGFCLKQRASLTINGDLCFSSAAHDVAEGAGLAVVTVLRGGNTNLTASVNYMAAEGTATAGADFLLASGTLLFAPGETARQLTVPILDDWRTEPPETLSLALTAASGALLGEPRQATLTIADDDRNGVVALLNDAFFVDVEDEAANLSQIAQARGYDVAPFTLEAPDALSGALQGASILHLPELERWYDPTFVAALGAEGRATISNFVASGGGLVVHGDATGASLDLLNSLFSLSLARGIEEPGTSSLTQDAALEFGASLPESIPENVATRSAALSSLAHGIMPVYVDEADSNATVLLFRHGDGVVVYLGYDWSQDAPAGTQDGGWNDVMAYFWQMATSISGLVVEPAVAFSATGPEGGPFTPAVQAYTPINPTSADLTWSVLHAPEWLTLAPTGGTILPHSPGGEIAASVNASAASLPMGLYADVIVFTNHASGALLRREAALTVQGDIALARSALDLSETNGVARIDVTRGGRTNLALSVDYWTEDGTAAAGSDYAAVAGTWVFAPGETTRQIEIPLVDDPLGELAETFTFHLGNLVGGVLGEPSVATITLQDDDLAAVSLFSNPAFVDMTPDTDGEVWNLAAAITNHGYALAPFTGTSAADFLAAAQAARVIHIPETENGAVDLNLDDDAAQALAGFVEGGGCLIAHSFPDLLNRVFGFGLLFSGSQSSTSQLDPQAAAGTPFADGPATLPAYDITSGLLVDSLPEGALALYRDDSDLLASVVLIPRGDGWIVYLGFDWNDAAPAGTQDGGWNDVLGRALALAGGLGRVPLPEALDTGDALVWETGGDAAWVGVPDIGHDGVDAAWIGGLGHRQRAELQTVVEGPCVVSFWWRVSCEPDWDGLEIVVDGAAHSRISGDSGWSQGFLTLEEGPHTLVWAYAKDGADLDPVGEDCAWLDQVVIGGGSVLPADWLALYGLPADGSADDLDTDGDGKNNWEEWVSGTIPTDPASLLQMEGIAPDAAGMRVRWQSVAGKRYDVLSCDELASPPQFAPWISDVAGEAGSTEVLDDRPAPSGARFYRVVVQDADAAP